METNKIILSELKLRSLIAQEINNYLITEGLLSNLKAKIEKLNNKFSSSIVAAMLVTIAADKPNVKAESDLFNDQQIEQFYQIVEKQKKQLQAFGLTEETADKIISSVLEGAKKSVEQKQNIKLDLNDEELAQEILNSQKNEISKLNDINIVKDILIVNFQKDIQNQGNTQIVKSAVKSGKLGSPVAIDALLTGLGYTIQKELVSSNDESFVSLVPSKIKNQNNLKFNFMDLNTYWDDLIVDNSKIEQEMRKEADILLPYHYYETGGGAYMQSHIESKLQKENLRNKIHQLRGLYV